MPRVNSRSKGRRGEVKAKEVLQKWTGMEFHRVPASGGLRWKKTDNITGDLICGHPTHRFDFSIEVKNYREINFEHLLMPQVKSIITNEFWPQCLKDADRGKKIPLLMMRYDGIRPGDFFFLVMRYLDFKFFKKYLDTTLPYFKYGKLVILNSNILFETDYDECIKPLSEKLIKKLWN